MPPPGGGEEHRRDKLNMPPEIRARFEAAREKAMQDPALQELRKKAEAANEEFRKAMREAMSKADPGLAEYVKKQIGEKMKEGRPEKGPGFANLSEEDRQKLMAAREKAKSDPAVTAAEEAKKAAKSPEERRTAMEQFHKAMNAAILKVDPSLAPILEKMKAQKAAPPPHQGPPPPPGMPGDQMDGRPDA
ncbi:MAG: hypothetical protein IAE94_12175 [Chthoniobacterales bacterium]|nr:hypothetical protein [Chthoniobacterales bacterium]